MNSFGPLLGDAPVVRTINLFYRNPNDHGTLATCPKHLANKFLQIRRRLAVSQGDMVKLLGVQDLIHYTTLSKYELDKNEPSLVILLAYARLAGIPVERIIDNELELTI